MPINLRALSMLLVLSGLVSLPVLAAESSTDTLLRGAKKWVDKDRADIAKTMLKKAILLDPNSQEALYMMGRIELKDGKSDEATKYLHKLKQTAPGGKRTQELNDAIYGKVAPALKAPTASFVKPVPSLQAPTSSFIKPTKPVTKLSVATAKQDPSKQVKQIKKSKRNEPELSPEAEKFNADEAAVRLANDPDVIARTDALDALADGNIDQAETSLLDIIKRRPNDPEVIGGLGLVQQKRGNFIESEKYFIQAVAAAQGEESEAGRWESLIQTSKFSQYMTNAKALLNENKLPEAEAAIEQAIALKPGDPDTLAVRGNIKTAENNFPEAERLYREALKIEGYNSFATRGLANLLVRMGRSEEALSFIERVLNDYPNEWRKSPYSQASLLREAGNLYIAAHQPSYAVKAFEQAVSVDPKNPWVRFSLAKHYISLDLIPLARGVIQEGVNLSPDDPAMHQVQALVLLSLDDYKGALDSLNQIPENQLTQDLRETKNSALIKYYSQQANEKIAQGNRKEAMRIMAVAQTLAQGDYSATEQVAEAWFRLDQQKLGLAAMRALPQPAPLQTQVRFASLLNRAKQDQDLEAYLPTLRIPEGNDDTSKKYRASIQEIEFAMAGRHYDKLIKAGKTVQAQQFADTIMNANQLSTSDYFRFHRSYFSKAQLPENAIAMLNQEKEQSPDDMNIRYELAHAYSQDKQNSNSQREIQELLAMTKSDDIDMRLRIAGLQQSVGDSNGARRTVRELTTSFPNNTEVLLQAGNIARSSGKYNQAMRYYQKSKAQSLQPQATNDTVIVSEQGPLLNLLPKSQDKRASKSIALVSSKESDSIYRSALAADTGKEKPKMVGLSAIDEAMNSIAAQRSAKIEAGLDIQSKTAGNGTSTYNSIEVPMLARFPIGYEAHGTIQVDKVSIDAGSLPVAFNDAALFGKIHITQTPLAAPLAQTASGTSIGLGYEQSGVKADIGLVGQGFPVRNVVGGIRTGGDFGGLSYSLSLSRRPYTGSLLSYAGAKDPISGITWGGVTNTGLSLYMSTTLGDFNVSGMGSYGLLRGQNVLNNSRLYLRAAIDTDIYTTDDSVLNIGLSASYTSFAKNQAFYTFGHGGYYSPQSSLSFSLPVELSGRADLLSYQVRASVSYSRTREDAAVFYPTDAALQAQAALGPNFPPGNSQAIYQGGAGGGFGYGLLAATEYRLTPNFALGGRFTMDRSAYYAPNNLFFYGRYMFNPETGAVKMRPEFVTPYAQY